METYEEQILAGFEEALRSYPQECRASQPPWPGSGEALKMTVGSGRQCSMLLEESSRLGVFSKILLESSLWTNSKEYCYVWEILDTRFGCSAFQLTPLGLSTDGSGCSLWPTAHANCSTGAGSQGRDGGLNLQTAAKLWPTPRANESYQGDEAMQAYRDAGYRQPKVRNGQSRKGTFDTTLTTAAVAKLWPTPTEWDWKSTSHGNQGNARPLSEVAGLSGSGSLNPRFVSELMGFPADWTELQSETGPLSLKPSATHVFPNRRSHSSRPSAKLKHVAKHKNKTDQSQWEETLRLSG